MVSFCYGPLSVVHRPSVHASKISLKNFPLKPLIGFWPNFTGMFPRCSSNKFVQMVPVGCISRSRGQKNRFLKCNFQTSSCPKLQGPELSYSFYILYIASSRGPLPKLFKLWPLGQNWPHPWGHNFTLNYIRKSLNDISWTANGNFTKLDRKGPWVVPYKKCLNGFDSLHK